MTSLPSFSEPEPELEDARLACPKNYNYRTMNCGRGTAEIITVAGTSRFQESLRCAAEAPSPWRHKYDRHLPAFLVAGQDDAERVAVLIDGQVVGYLPREVAEQHRQQLDSLDAAGQHLVCSALVVGGEEGKYLGIRFQIKPGIGTRWAANAKL
ncbi:MAG TPA: hypothetical protein VME44_08415 [Streptosporangiaceae bacterium]|nr:hypothetical protein [Streptosporangiaceae bacterium]